MNTWTGIIGHVGKPMLDGRTIAQIRTDLERGVVPLEEALNDPFELILVGKVLACSIDKAGTVTAAGRTTLEPGDYLPSLILCAVELEGTHASGTLAAVTARRSVQGDTPAAWLDAKITVVAA